MNTLDDLVGPDHPVRPLIKLLLYGYLHGISSSRKLAAEAGRNIEVIWLLSTLAPSYNLIADHRKDYPDQLALNDALEDAEQDLAASGTEARGTEPELMEQIERLHRHIRKLEAARDRLAASEASRLPISDPEARSMRAPHRGKPPAYNLQAMV